MKLIPSEPDIKTLVERIDVGDIDLQPDFQRQEVWSIAKKKRLIDTVLRGWSIPPLHLVEIAEGKLEVLDGQQRLASLRDFVHNRFSIDGSISPADDRISVLNGKFYRKLDEGPRRQVEQFPIRCFKIVDYSPEEPSELFYRLNQPTVLTAGEQRNALYGPARQQLKQMVLLFESEGNDKSALGFSNLRLAYDDILARALYFVEAGTFGVKSTESRISERFRQKDAFDKRTVNRVENSIQHFSEARRRAVPSRFNKASVLSWLLFYSRFFELPTVPNPEYMQTFFDALAQKYTSNFVTEASAVFEDRASLRVTDVASVAYRDFVLNYVYYFLDQGSLPPVIPLDVIRQVEEDVRARADVSFEYAVSARLDVDAWSRTL